MESAGNSTIQTLSQYEQLSLEYLYRYDGTPQVTEGYNCINTFITATDAGVLRIRQSIDSEIWDVTDTHTYTDQSLNEGVFVTTPVKAKYCNVQFDNISQNTNDIRLQTLLNNAFIPGLMDVNILSTPIDVNVINDTSYVTIINTLANPVPVTFTDLCLNINVTATITDISNVTINNTQDNPVPVQITNQTSQAPIETVWENNEITHILNTITGQKCVVYNIYATNFAPDYRYLKLYNKTTVDPLSDRPFITMPLPPDLPQFLHFPTKGINFENGLATRVTRLYNYNDQNVTLAGDIALTVMYQ